LFGGIEISVNQASDIPVSQELIESFHWAQGFKPFRPNLIKGVALNVGTSLNRNVYSDEELVRAARTLIGKPLLVNHDPTRLVGQVLDSEFEDNRVEYIAQIEDAEVFKRVLAGEINHVSIGAGYRKGTGVDGFEPEGIVFAELSLIAPPEIPGDPSSSVTIMEKLLTSKPQTSPVSPAVGEGEPMSESGKGEERSSAVPVVLLTQEQFQQVKDFVEEKVGKAFAAVKDLEKRVIRLTVSERVWTRAYINDLPDSAFAVILPGGEKDDQGKTAPRSLRKLPHHTPDGSIDRRHLVNANSRLPQSDIPADARAEAERHLDAHKKELGIGPYAGVKEAVEDDVSGLPADVEDLELRVADLEDLVKSLPQKVQETLRHKPTGRGLVEANPEEPDSGFPAELKETWDEREREAKRFQLKRR